MDDFERRLKGDAEAIEAKVSARLEARIDAAIAATEADERKPRQARSGARFDIRWWWASTLTGAAAAFVLFMVAVMLRSEAPDDQQVPTVAENDAAAIETSPAEPPAVLTVPLDVRTADFAGLLQTELDALKSDLEKARDAVEDDLRFTF